MKKFGIVLPTWVYDGTRRKLADAAFDSLLKTKMLPDPVLLHLLIRESGYPYPVLALGKMFNLILETKPPATGTEQTLAYGTQCAFDNGCDYVIWMGDDALFNPNWLIELVALIDRHPNALSWSVYRSAYEAIHATLQETGIDGDVMVRSICGHGMTISKEEWQTWGIKWQEAVDEHWASPFGSTLDMHHAWARKGERWVTSKSYVDHTGKVGVHCTMGTPEYARNFEE